MGKRLNPLMFLSCVMICFYHPSKFSGHIRLVEQLACCPRPDGPWVEMYYPHQKKAMRCVHQLLLLQPPTRLVHEHWAHTGRSLRTSHSQSTSAEEALWSITSLWSTEPWPVHLPRLYLTSWGVIQVLFLQAISFLWAPFLLFFGCGKIPPEMGSLRSSSCVHFWAGSSPCAFWFIQGNNPPPSKEISDSHTEYSTATPDRTTVYHHRGRRKLLAYIFRRIH